VKQFIAKSITVALFLAATGTVVVVQEKALELQMHTQQLISTICSAVMSVMITGATIGGNITGKSPIPPPSSRSLGQILIGFGIISIPFWILNGVFHGLMFETVVAILIVTPIVGFAGAITSYIFHVTVYMET
jgi:sensor histidine kinase regulating citrate/malate metabolism